MGCAAANATRVGEIKIVCDIAGVINSAVCGVRNGNVASIVAVNERGGRITADAACIVGGEDTAGVLAVGESGGGVAADATCVWGI